MELVLNENTAEEIRSYLLQKDHGPLILFGDKGMGQGRVAENVARELLNLGENETLDVHPDFYSVYPDKGMIRIGQIEKLNEWCSYAQVEAKKKVILIYDAGLMNVNAQNALLKLLEDGNSNHIVILVTEHSLIDTIKSRCQIVVFQKPSEEQVKMVIDSLNPQMDNHVKEVACLLADGHIELLRGILSNNAFLQKMVSYISCLKNFSERKEILGEINGIREKDKSYMYDYLKDREDELKLFLKCNVTLFCNALYAKAGICNAGYCTEHIAGAYSIEELTNIVNRFVEGIYGLEQKKFTRNDFFRIYQTILGGI